MEDTKANIKCKACGETGTGNYCSRCGQPFTVKRISLQGLFQDIFHFFTHLEKGFGFTLKNLTVAPGQMQLAYMEGNRVNHQKPFAMFFICVTIASLVRYWIFNALMKFYHADVISEANFFHQYMVITYIVLLPVYSLITYLLFYRSKYNYAEIGVLMLYTLSLVFLLSSVISILILIWPELDIAYVEFPVFTFYFTITFISFFKTIPRWEVTVKSILVMVIAFMMNDVIEDCIIRLISKS